MEEKTFFSQNATKLQNYDRKLSPKDSLKPKINPRTVKILLYNRVFNCFKQHVYYVSINSFIYYVSKNDFLEQHVYNNMMFTALILDGVIFGMLWKI